MIQIELFGCTSAGKSSLLANILRACQDQGIEALTGDDLVLRQAGLNRVKNRLVRTLLTDWLALFACLLTCNRNLEFICFSIGTLLRLPVAVGWLERFNLARNILKKVGIYEIIHRAGDNRQVAVVDEGTLQAAHNLFVHVSARMDPADVSTFVSLVPLPELAVYVTQSKPVLIERTLARGHKRIPDTSYANVECFISRAVDTFDQVVKHVALKGRLLAIEPQQKSVASQDQPYLLPARVLEILRAEIDSAVVYASTISNPAL